MTKKQKIEQLKELIKAKGNCHGICTSCDGCSIEELTTYCCAPSDALEAAKKLLSKLTPAPRTKVRTYSEKEMSRAWDKCKDFPNYFVFIEELRKGRSK
jgi:hypothetical protein